MWNRHLIRACDLCCDVHAPDRPGETSLWHRHSENTLYLCVGHAAAALNRPTDKVGRGLPCFGYKSKGVTICFGKFSLFFQVQCVTKLAGSRQLGRTGWQQAGCPHETVFRAHETVFSPGQSAGSPNRAIAFFAALFLVLRASVRRGLAEVHGLFCAGAYVAEVEKHSPECVISIHRPRLSSSRDRQTCEHASSQHAGITQTQQYRGPGTTQIPQHSVRPSACELWSRADTAEHGAVRVPCKCQVTNLHGRGPFGGRAGGALERNTSGLEMAYCGTRGRRVPTHGSRSCFCSGQHLHEITGMRFLFRQGVRSERRCRCSRRRRRRRRGRQHVVFGESQPCSGFH